MKGYVNCSEMVKSDLIKLLINLWASHYFGWFNVLHSSQQLMSCRDSSPNHTFFLGIPISLTKQLISISSIYFSLKLTTTQSLLESVEGGE